MNTQIIIVAVVLTACAVYTLRRLWRRFTATPTDSPHCEGCPLADNCQHKHKTSEQVACAECKRQGSCCH